MLAEVRVAEEHHHLPALRFLIDSGCPAEWVFEQV